MSDLGFSAEEGREGKEVEETNSSEVKGEGAGQRQSNLIDTWARHRWRWFKEKETQVTDPMHQHTQF